MIILDTGFLFALKAEKDKNFKRANEILDDLFEKGRDLVLTSYLVLNETITLAVSRFNGNLKKIKLYYDLFWGVENFFKIVHFEGDEFRKIYLTLEKYLSPEKQLSYVDASLIYLFEKHKADYIVSFNRHFDYIINRLL
jgi:predicted nucleic acid-binding protein